MPNNELLERIKDVEYVIVWGLSTTLCWTLFLKTVPGFMWGFLLFWAVLSYFIFLTYMTHVFGFVLDDMATKASNKYIQHQDIIKKILKIVGVILVGLILVSTVIISSIYLPEGHVGDRIFFIIIALFSPAALIFWNWIRKKIKK